MRWSGLIAFFCLILCAVSVLSQEERRFVSFRRAFVVFGSNIGLHVRNRLQLHLGRISQTEFTALEDENAAPAILTDLSQDGGSTVLLSFGNTTISSTMCNIENGDISTVPESYSMIAQRNSQELFSFCVDGQPLSSHRHKNISFHADAIHYGAITGSYALLETLGFGFLHPLEPTVPSILRIDLSGEFSELQSSHRVVRHHQPYWPERGFHIHTQHPLEITEVLQGHDVPQFGPHGAHCQQFSKRRNDNNDEPQCQTPDCPVPPHYCERWEDMFVDVDYFFEWAVANRLNKVEWLLLGNFKWGDEWQTRQYRFQKLAELGHQYSLLIGVDVPIGNIQQHGWSMVNVRLPLVDQIKQIQERVDWILNIGFDFLTTESGLSEFTHPECELMLELLNAFAMHVNGTWGREAAIKVHCSTGQHCENILDPRTGDPLNFNFLPMYANAGLGVFPHTVQVYALDDPIGGAYGNHNFSYVEDYLVYEAKQAERAVMFYGETAYWVNVDVDVPLFLPLYGHRRLRDLRRIATREHREHFHIDGQMNFDSGWEWGYWLSDVITARASWDPFAGLGVETVPPHGEDDTAGDWERFANTLYPFTRLFGPEFGPEITHFLVNYSQLQAELLVYGRVKGRESPDLNKLSGIAYLSGFDTWTEIPRLLRLHMTQPNKVFLRETKDPLWPYVLELLEEMESRFRHTVEACQQLTQRMVPHQSNHHQHDGFHINDAAWKLWQEVCDGVNMLWLRSRHVLLLYDSKQAQILQLEALSSGESPRRYQLLAEARDVLKQATQVVKRREAAYRVDVGRVAMWRENPTVYRYGYLWSVHSLYNWWRDQGLAEESPHRTPHSTCYLNRMDSTEVAVGWGKYTLQLLRRLLNEYTPFTSWYPIEIVNCLSSPTSEYEFPRDLHILKPTSQ